MTIKRNNWKPKNLFSIIAFSRHVYHRSRVLFLVKLRWPKKGVFTRENVFKIAIGFIQVFELLINLEQSLKVLITRLKLGTKPYIQNSVKTGSRIYQSLTNDTFILKNSTQKTLTSIQNDIDLIR